MSPHLSIVIPSHGRADLLAACLRSVVRFAPGDTQVLVVDDASSCHCVSTTARRFAGVEVLRLPRRQGFCGAVSAGLAQARAPIIELLNDDTEVTAGWADVALSHFARPAVGAVAPLVLSWSAANSNTTRIDSAGDRYYLGGVAGKRGHGQFVHHFAPQAEPVFGASASSAFYRREALERVGGLPREFGAYFEDVDLSFRLRRAGYDICLEPGSRVWHHGSATHGTTSRALLEQQSLNEERVFWRNLPAAALPLAVPRHLAVLLGKAARRWREGNLVPFLCGRLRLVAEIPALLRHRRWLRQLGAGDDWRQWRMETEYWG
ncbi:MAG: glycosyltransferase family 2 protein [Gemmataceae bacterium]